MAAAPVRDAGVRRADRPPSHRPAGQVRRRDFDDLNTAVALTLLEEAAAMKKIDADQKRPALAAMDAVLGLDLLTIDRADLRVRPKAATIGEDEIEATLVQPQGSPRRQGLRRIRRAARRTHRRRRRGDGRRPARLGLAPAPIRGLPHPRGLLASLHVATDLLAPCRSCPPDSGAGAVPAGTDHAALWRPARQPALPADAPPRGAVLRGARRLRLGGVRPGGRKLATLLAAISMLGFLFLYQSYGRPAALGTIALVDLIGLVPLAWTGWHAFQQ